MVRVHFRTEAPQVGSKVVDRSSPWRDVNGAEARHVRGDAAAARPPTALAFTPTRARMWAVSEASRRCRSTAVWAGAHRSPAA